MVERISRDDPTLRTRLAAMSSPTLVVWGESDRIANKDYGRGYAESIPGSRFETIPEAGYLPQIEQSEKVLHVIKEFALTAS